MEQLKTEQDEKGRDDKSVTDGNADINTKSTLAQFLATVAVGLILMCIGFIFGMPAIVIGSLSPSVSKGLTMKESEASWFASIVFIGQPVGSIGSGFVQDVIGRRLTLVLVNIPLLVSWLLIYSAQSILALDVAITMMGVCAGFMQAPVLTYVGESTQPHLRGILLSTVQGIFFGSGLLLETVLGAVVDWRTMALMTALGPLVTFVALLFIPESPAWLVYMGKVRKGREALCWLRGWVTPDKVQKELNVLVKHIESTKQSKPPDAEGQVKHSKPSVMQNIRYFLKPPIQRPYRLLFVYTLVSAFTGLLGIRPFLVELSQTLQMPVQPRWILLGAVVLHLSGSACCMPAFKLFGKRNLSLYTMIICSAADIAVGVYLLVGVTRPWIPILLISVVFFCSAVGIVSIPFILISEVFPLQGRSVAGGLTAATSFVFCFIVVKFYIDCKVLFGLSGTFILYGIVGLFGLVFLYFKLPETEGKSLIEIESFFNKPSKSNENKCPA